MSDTPPDDLAILHPQVTVTVGDQDVTVRELTLAQSLAVHADLQPLLADLLPHYASEAGIDSELILAVLARHPDLTIRLLAHATGRPAAWVGALRDSDGYLLMLHFVRLNTPFFAARLETAHQAARRRQALGPPTLATSSPASFATGTTPPH